MKMKILITILFIALNSLAGIKLTTFNIRNFDYDPRYNIHTNKAYLKDTLTELDFDLMAVQEIVQDRVFIQFIEKNFPQYGVLLSNCGGQNDQKLGFVYNKRRLILNDFEEDLRLSVSREGQDPKCYTGSRPALIAKFYDRYDKQTFTAIALHLKSGGEAQSIQKRFYQIELASELVKELKRKGEENFVLMGDFNTTEYIQKDKEYKRFLNIFKKIDMQDLSEQIKCTSYWFGGIDDDKEYPTILDHIVVSGFLQKKLKRVEVAAHCKKTNCSVADESSLGVSFDEVSDHCPMTATFN